MTRPDVLSSPSPVNFGLSSKNPFGPVRAICMRLGKYTAAKRDRITTTMQRKWLSEIVAQTKNVEYREINEYWTKTLARVRPPFELRLINGMHHPIPEATVLVYRITIDKVDRRYELHIEKILKAKHWDKTRRVPKP